MSQIGKARCGCSKHDYVKESSFSLKKIEQRPFREVVIDFMISNKLLSPRAKYLCSVCAEEVSKLIPSEDNAGPSEPKRIKLNALDVVLEEVKSGKMVEHDMCRLAIA